MFTVVKLKNNDINRSSATDYFFDFRISRKITNRIIFTITYLLIKLTDINNNSYLYVNIIHMLNIEELRHHILLAIDIDSCI